MTTWWHYLLLANLYLVLFYAFYTLLLKRETFFQLNRIYLLASAVLSFLLPLVQLEWVKHWFITEKVEQTIYLANPGHVFEITAMPDNSTTLGDVLSYAYLFGLLFTLVKLAMQLQALRNLLKRPESGTAYSFFNIIQVDNELPEHELITAHEQAHSSQWHSADRMLSELLLIVNWFNPVAYLYRKALKHLHEFIADQQVVNQGASRKQYAQLLVSQAFHMPTDHLGSAFFNKNLLKQRIIMLQKNKSNRVALVKYGLSAPLFAAMLVLSSATLSKTHLIKRINNKAEQALDAPADIATLLKEQDKQQTNQAQQNVPVEDAFVDGTTEQKPSFPGGMDKFYDFLGRNIRYPAAARTAKIGGQVVVQFTVKMDGSLSNIQSLKGPGYGLDEEAIRVVASSPAWIPGKKDGKPAIMALTIPIQFTIADTDEKPAADSKVIIIGAPINPKSDTVQNGSEVFTEVEQSPDFPGGIQAFYNFLSSTIHYPAEARKAGKQGRVIVTFIVEKDGSLSSVKAIRGPGYGLDEEAARAIATSPHWNPGKQNGKPVRVQYTVPIQFTLPNKSAANDAKEGDGTNNTPKFGNAPVRTFVNPVNGDTSRREPSTFGTANPPPLYIVNGKEVANISSINPERIKTVMVWKGAEATKKYGDKGANGIVEVTLKP